MAAPKTHLALFLQTFSSVRFAAAAGDATEQAKYQNLTDDDVTLTNQTGTGAGQRSATVTSTTRHFTGDNQTWTPAPADTDLGLYTLVNAGSPLASVADLATQTAEGLYEYTDGAATRVGVVLASGHTDAEKPGVIENIIRSALVYDIATITPTVPASAATSTVLMDGFTFYGNLTWQESSAVTTTIPATDYGTLSSGTTGA